MDRTRRWGAVVIPPAQRGLLAINAGSSIHPVWSGVHHRGVRGTRVAAAGAIAVAVLPGRGRAVGRGGGSGLPQLCDRSVVLRAWRAQGSVSLGRIDRNCAGALAELGQTSPAQCTRDLIHVASSVLS